MAGARIGGGKPVGGRERHPGPAPAGLRPLGIGDARKRQGRLLGGAGALDQQRRFGLDRVEQIEIGQVARDLGRIGETREGIGRCGAGHRHRARDEFGDRAGRPVGRGHDRLLAADEDAQAQILALGAFQLLELAQAQTRAISRACRSAFAFVVTYMDAGLETTPAEEVPDEGFADAPHPKPAPRLVDADVIDVEPVRVAKAEPIRKKQPVAAMEDGADWQTARFIKGNRQDKTSKAGKKYTQWGAFVEIEGAEKAEWLNTIDRDLGETVDALENGENVLLQVKVDDYGRKLAAIRTADVPTKAEPKTEELAEDDIPF